MAKIRLNIEVSQDLADLLDTLAQTEDTTRSEIVRRAISVLKAYKEQRDIGRSHLGFTKDPQRLDAEMLGILNSSATAGTGISSASVAIPATPPVKARSAVPAPSSGEPATKAAYAE
jgi:hypothetical protein